MQNFDFHTDHSEENGGLKTRMFFSGFLTLPNAEEIKASLQNLNDNAEQVELWAKDVSGIDVSFLQIIESYKKEREENGQKVTILMELPYDLKTLLANAGIAYPEK